ncbi:MAG: CoA-binding protein [Phycisphaerae bacterium]
MSAGVVAVIGASSDRRKYGNKAVRAYKRQGWKVYPVHSTAREIEGLPAVRSIAEIREHVNRATLYLPPSAGMAVLEEIAGKGVDEFFVNPGAESEELLERARSLGLNPIVACSIVDIGLAPGEL